MTFTFTGSFTITGTQQSLNDKVNYFVLYICIFGLKLFKTCAAITAIKTQATEILMFYSRE